MLCAFGVGVGVSVAVGIAVGVEVGVGVGELQETIRIHDSKQVRAKMKLFFIIDSNIRLEFFPKTFIPELSISVNHCLLALGYKLGYNVVITYAWGYRCSLRISPRGGFPFYMYGMYKV